MRALLLLLLPVVGLLIHRWVNANRTDDQRLLIGAIAHLILSAAFLTVVLNTAYLVWRMNR